MRAVCLPFTRNSVDKIVNFVIYVRFKSNQIFEFRTALNNDNKRNKYTSDFFFGVQTAWEKQKNPHTKWNS